MLFRSVNKITHAVSLAKWVFQTFVISNTNGRKILIAQLYPSLALTKDAPDGRIHYDSERAFRKLRTEERNRYDQTYCNVQNQR